MTHLSRSLALALAAALLATAADAGPYALVSGSQSVTRTNDGATIPPDPRNSDWQAYQVWIAEGNVPDLAPVVAPLPATFTLAQFTALLTATESDAIYASTDPKVRRFLLTRAGTSFTMAQVKTGLDYLVTAKLLTADRETVLLGASGN